MGRTDYYDDPDAPRPNSIVPGGSSVVVDEEGRFLLQKRRDSGNWALPGGTMQVGETLTQTVIRETKEETGYDIAITGLLGIYTDPRHVIAYDDGEVRQEFVVAFTGKVIGGDHKISDESTDVRWFRPTELADLVMHETVRLRLQHYQDGRQDPYLG